MAEIAIMGYGTVGSGVFEVLRANQNILEKKAGQPLHVKKILDLRSFPGDPAEPYMTTSAEDILEDESIDIVVEAMGGLEPANSFVRKALSMGKHVVTSNKVLVAQYGADLLALALENRVSFLFEASVGGGIPIIRPLNQTLTTDEISQIVGILNGTTNYILTQMDSHQLSFGEALRQAQDMGYAERNPSDDVSGCDACRKLAILLSLSMGRHVDYEEIYMEGITGITDEDFAFARATGSTIKLLARGDIREGRLEAIVAPALVAGAELFATVRDAYNAVMFTSNMMDNVLFYGQGAGKLPTAGAMVSDIVEAALNSTDHIRHVWAPEKMPVAPSEEMISAKLVRLACDCRETAEAAVRQFFDTSVIGAADAEIVRDQLAFIAPPMTERQYRMKIAQMTEAYPTLQVKNAIRLYAGR